MRKWVTRIRTVTAWLVIPAAINFFVAARYINVHYPMGFLGRNPPHNFLVWRNAGLVALLILTLVSLPRWQSFVGVAALIVFITAFGD